MKATSLRDPFVNGFGEADKAAAEQYLAYLNDVKRRFRAGELFVRFVDGDRKGSVAMFKPSPKYRDTAHQDAEIRYSSSGFQSGPWWRIDGTYLHGECTWNGRRNKIALNAPHRDVELLLDYQGDTVWQVFDAKAAREEILKNPDQEDIDGRVLAAGDRVLYINARYGSAVSLDFGYIKEFKASVNSKTHSITTIIQSDGGEFSEINYPHRMVYKIMPS